MRLNSIRLLNGPSLFCSSPCVLATLGEATPSSADDAVLAGAARHWPDLDLAADDTPAAVQLIAQLSRKLLLDLGLPASELRVRIDPPQNKAFIAVPEQNRALTAEIVAHVCRYALALHDGTDSRQISTRLQQVHDLLRRAGDMNKKAACADMQRHLATSAVPWLALDLNADDRDLIQLGFGRQQYLLRGTTGQHASQLGVETSLSKRHTQTFLRLAGFPVPDQVSVSSVDDAAEKAAAMGYPVVLKGEHGSKGERVFADLRSEEELRRSYRHLASLIEPIRHATRILLEDHVPGRIYRVEVLAGRFFDAYDMVPAGVSGDGVHSVAELIALENQRPCRISRGNDHARYRPLQLGDAERLMLRKQGLTADSVPGAGDMVQLSANSNWSAGGTFHRVSDQVHADNRRLIEQCVAALGIDIAGVDVVSADLSRSFVETPLTIIEVNHSPYIASYEDEHTGERLDNGPRLVERLAPDCRYGDVPIIVMPECASAASIQDALASRLNAHGLACARIRDDLIEVDGKPAAPATGLYAPDPALTLLRRPDAGSVLLSRALSALADSGIGSGGCDVAIIGDCSPATPSTRVWSCGVPAQDTLAMLVRNARAGAVICLDGDDAHRLCRQLPPARCAAVHAPGQAPDADTLASADTQAWHVTAADGTARARLRHAGKEHEYRLEDSDVRGQLVALATLALLGVPLETN